MRSETLSALSETKLSSSSVPKVPPDTSSKTLVAVIFSPSYNCIPVIQKKVYVKVHGTDKVSQRLSLVTYDHLSRLIKKDQGQSQRQLLSKHSIELERQ